MMKDIFFITLVLLSITNVVAKDKSSQIDEMKALLFKAEEDACNYAAKWEVLVPDSSKELKIFSEKSPEVCVELLCDSDVSFIQKIMLINILNVDMDIQVYADISLSISEKYVNDMFETKLMNYVFSCPFSDKKAKKKLFKNKKLKQALDNCIGKSLDETEIKNYKRLKRGWHTKEERILYGICLTVAGIVFLFACIFTIKVPIHRKKR